MDEFHQLRHCFFACMHKLGYALVLWPGTNLVIYPFKYVSSILGRCLRYAKPTELTEVVHLHNPIQVCAPLCRQINTVIH